MSKVLDSRVYDTLPSTSTLLQEEGKALHEMRKVATVVGAWTKY